MCTSDSGNKKKAVFILEDEPRVLDAWLDALSDALGDLGDVYVFGAGSTGDANSAIARAKAEGYGLAVVLVDQVHMSADGERDADWGIEFLKKCQRESPGTYRIMFSGESQRGDIQRVLDEGLIHHFEAKGVNNREDVDHGLIVKIRQMVEGTNVGNVQSPTAKEEFKRLWQEWIKTLPDQGKTEIPSLGTGKIVTVEDVLDDPQLFADFFEAYRNNLLDRQRDSLFDRLNDTRRDSKG